MERMYKVEENLKKKKTPKLQKKIRTRMGERRERVR